jgi:GTP-binding protein
MLIGRIQSGKMKVGDKVQAVDSNGLSVETGKVIKIIKKFGMAHVELEQGFAGDIVSIAGLANGTVNHTINIPGKFNVIPSIPIDPPMISLQITYNDSPLKGTEGDKCTINLIRERILREAEDDVSLRVNQATIGADKIEISGRGDLHLGVLIEKMRREGFELAVTPPQVIMQQDPNNPKKLLEPFEEVTIDTDMEYLPMIIERLNGRKGILLSAEDQPDGRQLIKFKVPSRGLLGFRTELINDTRGSALMKSQFLEYDEHAGAVKKNPKGAIISTAAGMTTAYALRDVEEKGTLFVGSNTPTYMGMVIGEYVLEDDMEMNPCKEKHLTNIRSKGSEEQIKLVPPKIFGLEEAITYIRDDELVEVTPKWIRIRKRILDQGERRRMKRNAKKDSYS